jgi:hypothetical protein
VRELIRLRPRSRIMDLMTYFSYLQSVGSNLEIIIIVINHKLRRFIHLFGWVLLLSYEMKWFI